MTSTTTRRLPIWLSVVLAALASLWLTGGVLVAFTGAQPAPAVRWTLLPSELSASLLLAAIAWCGTRSRPQTPTAFGVQAAAIATGTAVTGLAVLAAALGKTHELDLSSQILFTTAVAVGFYTVVRSRPAS